MVQKRILTIDDEPDVRAMLKARLESKSYEVIAAADGEEGLEKVEYERPDLIILDVMMPRMDGYTFIREMRNRYPDLKIPIIVLTAKDKLKDLFEIEGIGDYLTKPYDAQELLQKIEKFLGTK